MNYYRITTQIVNADTGAVINTGATCYGNFGSSAGTSSTNQLTVGGTKNVSSSSDNLYLNAVVASGYTFAKWSCYCSEFSSSKRTQEFTANPFTSNNNWNLKDVVGSHTSSGNRLDLTVTLYVSPVKFTLTYNANGGSSTPSSQTATSGSSITLAGAITRSGYSFGGWSINGRTYAAGASYTLTANATATAVWNQAVTYTVKFQDAGIDVATVTGSSGQTIGSGGTFAWPTLTAAPGYTLEGWKIGTTTYPLTSRYSISGNVTATAVWSGSSSGTYPITPSTSSAGTDYTYNLVIVLKNGLSVKLPEGFAVADSITNVKASKSGLLFYNGTNRSPVNYGCINGLQVNISGTIKGETASVSGTRAVSGHIFSARAGYSSDETQFVIDPPEGYQAYGWLWGRGTNATTFTTGFTAGSSWSHQLWTIISSDHPEVGIVPILIKVHTVTFDANGGSGAPSPIKVAHGENWTCPSTFPTRAGYTCKGWSTSKTSTSPEFVAGREYGPLNSDLTVYAVWVPNQGTLVYNANGGTVAPQYKLVTVGEAYGTLPTPSRSGCAFLGWFTAASGGTHVSATTKMGTGGIAIIYAHWETGSVTTSVTVTLNANGGTLSTSYVIATGIYPTLPNPTRPGYSFAGWFSTPFGNVQLHAGDSIIFDEDHEIYARWNRGKSVITFDANGGTCGQATKEVSFGTAAGRLPTASMDGKNFDGWYTDRENGEKVSASTVITSSLTVYAHYSTFKTTPWVTITISD